MTETYSKEGPQCPYCGRQFTADESHYYDEQNYTEDDCDQCGKKFAVSLHTSIAWSCEPIDDGIEGTFVDVSKSGDGK